MEIQGGGRGGYDGEDERECDEGEGDEQAILILCCVFRAVLVRQPLIVRAQSFLSGHHFFNFVEQQIEFSVV